MESDTQPMGSKLAAIEIQQEYYEAVGEADWELYTKRDRPYLLQKIAVALFGPPTKEGDLRSGASLDLQGYEKRQEDITKKVFDKICEQAKYSHDSERIFISIIRVVCVFPNETIPIYKITPADYWVGLHEKRGDEVTTSIFHVFSIRKCIATDTNKDVNVCRLFIDHDARVYQSWDLYLANNNLAECVMVVPENGQYKGTFEKNIQGDEDSSDLMPLVKCSVVPSPALGLGVKVLNAADTASSVANIGALAGLAGTFFVPAAAPVLIPTAIGVGVVTGAYAIARSTANLIDRKKHEQDIGFGDGQARASWINIMVSTAGISATGATKLLSWAAASGTNVQILMNAVRVIQYTNLGTGFIGVANSLRDMIIKYKDYDETPTKLEIFQFTTSALFLGLGVMTNQTAQEIVHDAQATTINDIRDSLPSNVKKKMFDKVTAETRRVKGTVAGNADVIKALNRIDNKNEFFAKLARINKQINKNKLRVSLAPDGNALFNNKFKVDVNKLQGLGTSGRDQLFAKYGPATVNTKNAPTRIYASTSSTASSTWTKESQWYIRPEEILKISNFILSLSKIDQEYIAEILSQISSELHDAFLLFCSEIIGSFVLTFEIKEMEKLLGDSYKVRIVLFVFNYIKSKININDDDTELSFANVLKEFVVNGRIKSETILKIKILIMQKRNEKKDQSQSNPRVFDDVMFNFRQKYRTGRYTNLEPGETMTIGNHQVLVKSYTVDKLEECLEMFSQEECDTFLNICFKVIKFLSAAEIDALIKINFDEDIIMRVSYYMLFETESVLELIALDSLDEALLQDIASDLKNALMKWRSVQEIRKHQTCSECSGIRYHIDE